MAIVWIPDIASDCTGGEQTVETDGETVSAIIRNLERAYPGIGEVLLDNNALRPGIMVAVDGNIGSRNLLQPVGPDSELHFIPALSGG